ncbi:MAG: hypothetical protein D3910_28450, partial [Candidatus Electrothrix sp. ATG2]|nr:hypothetical protein [Candidatus Electrothrix sp. ATG2]
KSILNYANFCVDYGVHFNPLARTINGNLSSFIIGNYPINRRHAVLSDVGAWRQDAPVNDASVNYLYTGLKCQPTMVIMPTFIDDGTTIIFKIWSWGLGENLNYPAGFEFGRLDIKHLYYRIIYNETKKMLKLSQLIDRPPSKIYSKDLLHNISIIKSIHEKQLKSKNFEQMLSFLVEASEIENSVKKILGTQISGIFSCLAGMYADSYHLIEYRTLPKLPSLLPSLPGIEFLVKPLEEYYYVLLENLEIIEPNKELLANIYMDIADAFSRIPVTEKVSRKKLANPFALRVSKILIEHKPDLPTNAYNQLLDRVNIYLDYLDNKQLI